MRKIDRDTVLACLDAQGTIETCAAELVALAEYEMWRAAFDAGCATLDGRNIEEISVKAAARGRQRRRERVKRL